MKLKFLILAVMAIALSARVVNITRVSAVDVASLKGAKAAVDTSKAALEASEKRLCDLENAVKKANNIPESVCYTAASYANFTSISGGVYYSQPYYHFTEDYHYILKEQ